MWAVNDLVGCWWIRWESEHSLAAVRVMHRKEDAVRCCKMLYESQIWDERRA